MYKRQVELNDVLYASCMKGSSAAQLSRFIELCMASMACMVDVLKPNYPADDTESFGSSYSSEFAVTGLLHCFGTQDLGRNVTFQAIQRCL